MTTDQDTMEQTKNTASKAADEGKQVGAVAKEEARHVAETATQQARSVAHDTVGQLRGQLTEQTSGQRDRLVTTLQSLGDDFQRMADQSSDGGMAGDLARQAADRARALKEHLDGREPGQILDDVRDLARRRPGTFLLGALAAGVVAGRLLRATADGAAAATLATPTGADAGAGTAVPAAGVQPLTGQDPLAPLPSTTTMPPTPPPSTMPATPRMETP